MTEGFCSSVWQLWEIRTRQKYSVLHGLTRPGWEGKLGSPPTSVPPTTFPWSALAFVSPHHVHAVPVPTVSCWSCLECLRNAASWLISQFPFQLTGHSLLLFLLPHPSTCACTCTFGEIVCLNYFLPTHSLIALLSAFQYLYTHTLIPAYQLCPSAA